MKSGLNTFSIFLESLGMLQLPGVLLYYTQTQYSYIIPLFITDVSGDSILLQFKLCVFYSAHSHDSCQMSLVFLNNSDWGVQKNHKRLTNFLFVTQKLEPTTTSRGVFLLVSSSHTTKQ